MTPVVKSNQDSNGFVFVHQFMFHDVIVICELVSLSLYSSKPGIPNYYIHCTGNICVFISISISPPPHHNNRRHHHLLIKRPSSSHTQVYLLFFFPSKLKRSIQTGPGNAEKMCLHAVNSLSEAHKVVSDSELPVFILDDVGYTTDSRSIPGVQLMNRVESEISVMLTDDLVEDG
ncbi:hypothetical protein GQ457_07G019630 [Hibiscus cannabinus]